MISIIIPVYNTEKYVNKCIESLLGQTYQNFEIIIIDDGSSDSSPALCDAFAAEYPKIRVIHQKNKGLSAARNRGLELAQGEYVFFLDSDDYLNENALQNLVNVQQKYQADLVIGGYCRVYDSGKDEEVALFPFQQNEVELSEYEFWKLSMFNMSAIVAWGKLYNRKLWEGESFPEGKINEDLGILPHIIPKCKRIVCTQCVTVNYRIACGSIMRSTFQLRHLDECEFRLECIQYLLRKKYIEIALHYWGEGVRRLITGKEKLNSNEPEISQRIDTLYLKFKKVAKEIQKFDIPLPKRIQLMIYCIHVKLYIFLKSSANGKNRITS